MPNNNFLTSLAIGLTSVQSSLACFIAERPVFWRESNRGMSHSAYFLAKNISQVRKRPQRALACRAQPPLAALQHTACGHQRGARSNPPALLTRGG